MRVVGITSFAIGMAVAVLTVGSTLPRSLDHLDLKDGESRLALATFYNEKTEAIRRQPRPPGRQTVIFMGDSTVASYPPEHQVPTAVQREINRLSRRRSPIRIESLAMAGTSIFDYYFMADVISATEPDLVMIPFNVSSTSGIFWSAFSRPELSGWVEAARLPETLILPINWVGLTADRLLLYHLIVALGGFEAWSTLTDMQLRFEQVRGAVEARLAHRDRRNRSPEEIFRGSTLFYTLAHNNLEGTNRYTPARTREQFGAALHGLSADHPTLAFVAASVRAFKARGIDCFVYVTPMNIDHIRSLGLANEAGLAETLSNLESVVRASGGDFADLHGIFRDEMFRDQPGHLAYEGGQNGPRLLAEELAPRLIQQMRSRRRRAMGRPTP